MEESLLRHMQELYGLNPSVPHRALQFPRLPPGNTHPSFKIFENPLKERFNRDVESMNTKLQGFQRMYQSYAAGLFEMNSIGIIPPGHPLYSRQNSVNTLKSENDKLQKENLELKKQLDQIKEKSKKQH